MKKRNKTVPIPFILLLVFGLTQFINPKKRRKRKRYESNYDGRFSARQRDGYFKKSCDDCHCNHTDYPWFDHKTPVN